MQQGQGCPIVQSSSACLDAMAIEIEVTLLHQSSLVGTEMSGSVAGHATAIPWGAKGTHWILSKPFLVLSLSRSALHLFICSCFVFAPFLTCGEGEVESHLLSPWRGIPHTPPTSLLPSQSFFFLMKPFCLHT